MLGCTHRGNKDSWTCNLPRDAPEPYSCTFWEETGMVPGNIKKDQGRERSRLKLSTQFLDCISRQSPSPSLSSGTCAAVLDFCSSSCGTHLSLGFAPSLGLIVKCSWDGFQKRSSRGGWADGWGRSVVTVPAQPRGEAPRVTAPKATPSAWPGPAPARARWKPGEACAAPAAS